jgi:transcriptional regulator with XRE-family HTH domain
VPKHSLSATFGLRVRYHRQLLNLTQEELAHRIGLTQGHLSIIERGIGNPKFDTLEAIAKALDQLPTTMISPPPALKSLQRVRSPSGTSRGRA